MSRETLLDDAIAKAKECGDCQLVEWLRMARGGESAARWYSDKLRDAHRIERKLMAENAKLREENGRLEQEMMTRCGECEAMLDCDECLRADASQKERKRLDYENAKLKELVRDMAAEIRGLGVDFKRVGWCDYADRMHELGVEV